MTPSSDTPPLSDDASTIEAAEADALPTSLGVFNPVGHMMVALPTQTQADALMGTLYETGWPDTTVRQFAPDDSVAQFGAMVGQAGHLAGFGYEITLLRRYLALAETGARWLLVKADDTDQAAIVARAARACGAVLAVHYRTLTTEELITEPAAR
jgi:hypothetical protein